MSRASEKADAKNEQQGADLSDYVSERPIEMPIEKHPLQDAETKEPERAEKPQDKPDERVKEVPDEPTTQNRPNEASQPKPAADDKPRDSTLDERKIEYNVPFGPPLIPGQASEKPKDEYHAELPEARTSASNYQDNSYDSYMASADVSASNANLVYLSLVLAIAFTLLL